MLFTTYADGSPKAKIIEPGSYAQMTWADWSKMRPGATDQVISSANIAFRVPEIVILTRFSKLPRPKLHFCRRTLFKRDDYRCQYCGKQPGTEECSIDHVLPRSRGGLTTWENCVTCCVECNRKKRNRLPNEANMALLKQPVKPKINMFHNFCKPIKSWEAFISTAYFNIELQNDM